MWNLPYAKVGNLYSILCQYHVHNEFSFVKSQSLKMLRGWILIQSDVLIQSKNVKENASRHIMIWNPYKSYKE